MCGGGGGGKASAAQERLERERQRRVQETTALINSIFADPAREQQYGDLRRSNYDFNLDRLGRDYDQAQRQLKFDVARRGQGGGSSDVDAFSLLKQNYDDALLNIGTHADQRAASLRNADEATRVNLLNQAQNDINQSQVHESALRQLQSNVDLGKTQDRLATVGNLLRGIALTGQAASSGYQSGVNQNQIDQYKNQFNTVFPTGGSGGSSGTITSIGR